MKRGELNYPYAPKAQRKCANCEWWDRILDHDDGFCRRYAPRAVLDGEGGPMAEDGEELDKAAWPVTFNTSWCGEFKVHHRFHIKTEFQDGERTNV